MLGLFRKYNEISRNESLNEIINGAKASESLAQAVGIVSFPTGAGLTQGVTADFAVSQELNEALDTRLQWPVTVIVTAALTTTATSVKANKNGPAIQEQQWPSVRC